MLFKHTVLDEVEQVMRVGPEVGTSTTLCAVLLEGNGYVPRRRAKDAVLLFNAIYLVRLGPWFSGR